eukprot:CAMPEP_0115860184 /NCGR_PEP_ID=MMETSP0287-20121206/16995_1 /TAXON_ID=412157 /ORGANISM="Chrysochromulina rotalis, Strain UIO044" /LENGTH=264 /DNA_ID=CAMNT_0003314497 /DNA_START=63 /DNA_END=857 /DNA_ORIENTATION=-
MLEAGIAGINCTDAGNLTPLSVAVQRGHTAVVKLLLAANADTEIKDKSGQWTALHHAAAEGSNELVGLLLDASANPNAQDNVKDTPLGEAIRHGHTKSVKLLLNAKASVFARNNIGRDALEIALRSTDLPQEIRDLLGRAGEEQAAAMQKAMAKQPTATATAVAVETPSLEEERGLHQPPPETRSPTEATHRSLHEEPTPLWAPQTRVMIDGLNSRPELNGTAATILGWDAASCRYKVRPDAIGEPIKLRPQCLCAACETTDVS